MRNSRVVLIFLLLANSAGLSDAVAAEPGPPGHLLAMSPELQSLFRAEMRELLIGVQTIAASLPTANWESIAKTATAMRESYILEKQLTATQEQELSTLPGEFRVLDEGFHVRAGKLAQAAMVKDAEAVSFQFARLLDACVACHTSFARTQFPQFRPAVSETHIH